MHINNSKHGGTERWIKNTRLVLKQQFGKLATTFLLSAKRLFFSGSRGRGKRALGHDKKPRVTINFFNFQKRIKSSSNMQQRNGPEGYKNGKSTKERSEAHFTKAFSVEGVGTSFTADKLAAFATDDAPGSVRWTEEVLQD